MAVILFDDQFRDNLLPLVFTRPVSGLRVGILTIAEKWSLYLNEPVSYLSLAYLQEKYPLKTDPLNVLVNASVCPDEELAEAIDKLSEGDALVSGEILLALKLSGTDVAAFNVQDTGQYSRSEYDKPFLRISFPEDLFRFNDQEIRKDFKILTRGRSSVSLSSTNTVLGEDIFVEDGVQAECSTFNTRQGPVYLGKNSQVWEGCHIRGSFALGHDSIVKMGARIYGMTTIGPNSKVGGEINNSVIYGNSAKGHDGYLGNSIVGEWCNIGADSNGSNMKNNYAEVRLWDYRKAGFRRTGLQFCGLVMADHSKCGINTMFNTGTVVGVSANIFGAGFPRNFVPDFAWGGYHGFETYRLEKVFETVSRVYERRNMVFSNQEKNILKHVFELTEKYRKF